MRFTKETVSEFISELDKKKYTRYDGQLDNEDYGYWKSFGVRKDEYNKATFNYQIAILFFDFSKYPQWKGEFPIGVQYKFILNKTKEIDCIDLTLDEDKATIENFEELCDEFYTNSITKLIKKLTK